VTIVAQSICLHDVDDQNQGLTAIQQDQADQGLVDDEFCGTSKMPGLQLLAQSEKASIRSLDSSLYLQTHVVVRCHQVY
jgi:hypothetical protein